MVEQTNEQRLEYYSKKLADKQKRLDDNNFYGSKVDYRMDIMHLESIVNGLKEILNPTKGE